MAYKTLSYMFQFVKIGGEHFPSIFELTGKLSGLKDYLPNISTLFGQTGEARTDIYG